jgi:hypothetical protein
MKLERCYKIPIHTLSNVFFFFHVTKIREEFSKHSGKQATPPSATSSTSRKVHQEHRLKSSRRSSQRENAAASAVSTNGLEQQLPASPLPRLRNLKAIMSPSSQRRNWQQETNDLLESIQRECNEVFERNKMRSSSLSSHLARPTSNSISSPRSTVVHVLVDEEEDEEGNDNDEAGSQPQTSVVESSLSGGEGSSVASSSSRVHHKSTSDDDLNRALDDTEALIQSILA